MVVTSPSMDQPDPGPHETSTQYLTNFLQFLVAWCVENDSLFCLLSSFSISANLAMKLSCSTRYRDIPAVVPPELPGSVHARYSVFFRIEFVIEEAEQLLACTLTSSGKSMVPPPCSRYSFTRVWQRHPDYLQPTRRGRHHGFFVAWHLFCLRTIYHRRRANPLVCWYVSGCIIDSFSLN